MVASPKNRVPAHEAALNGLGAKVIDETPIPVFGWTRVCHALNWHKCLSMPFVMLCCIYHNNFSQPAILYMMIHGLYGTSARRSVP
jgi:hypothetical protein